MRAFLLVTSAALLFTACSSDSTPGTSADGGADVASDAKEAGLTCPPYCYDGGHAEAGDAGLSCDQLKAKIDDLELQARACNPQIPDQCMGFVHDICCTSEDGGNAGGVTVAIGNKQAIDDLDQAVKQYDAQSCPKKFCLGAICAQQPSDVCSGQGSSGICQ